MLAVGFFGSVLGSVFGSVFGSSFENNRFQNSVDVRPVASLARRQASDAAVPAVPAVVLAFAMAYLARQSLTSASTSFVFVSVRWLVCCFVVFAVTLWATSDVALGSGLVVAATAALIGGV